MKKQNYQWPEYTVGVCYYPEHWDESLWASDLDRMLAAGIRVVRIAEFAWNLTEPEEGVFCFDFFDRFLNLCEKKGMKVIFGTPTATPPAWLTKKYPEVLNADQNGLPYEHGARRHYNYNAPIYREKVKTIVTALAEHYGRHPAICGWQIDNEMNCETCEFYSEADQAAFRVFLRESYGSLDALNAAWGTRFWNQTYTDWAQIRLPGHVLNEGWNPHQRLDYLRFVSESARSFCQLQANILRRYKKPGDFITTNALFGHIDNPKMNEESLDIFGYDTYPNFAFGLNRSEPLEKTGYGSGGDLNDRLSGKQLSEVRGICPHFSILEQQSGAGGWVSRMEGPHPRPGQIRLWAMQSVAHGADFVSFFRWRSCTFGTEMYWHGILDYDNRDNRRLREVTEFASDLKKIAPLCGSAYVAPLAIVKDYDNACDAEIDVWHGRLSFPDESAIYQQAQLSHVPCDYLHLADDSELEDLCRYPVLIYAHPAIMTEARAALLKAYVEQGGTLILGCRTGYKQENGQAVMLPPPGMLRELTGSTVRESGFQHPAEPTVTVDWNGERFEASVFQDQLEAEGGATVLARYDSSWFAGMPALIEHPLGSGRCLHWGSTFSRPVLSRLFTYLGLTGRFNDLLDVPETVEIAERQKDGLRFLMLLNYLPEAQTVVLHRQMHELLEDKLVSDKLTMPPFGVLVLEV